MSKSTTVVGLIVVIILGFLFFKVIGRDSSTDENSGSDDVESRVTIIDETDDDSATDETNDTADTGTDSSSDSGDTVAGDDPVDTGDTSDTVEPEPAESDESAEEPTTTQTIEGSAAADGAAIHGYSYEVALGKMIFEWDVKGSADKPIPGVTAGYDSDNNLVVQFPSLANDYVVTEEKETDLGFNLPMLTWAPDGEGSKYVFGTDAQSTFTLSGDEDEGKVILELDL